MAKSFRNHLLVVISLLFMFPHFAGAVEFGNFDGSDSALDAYIGKGKWVIVKIWARDCHVCNTEAHEYVAFHNKHKDSDAVVLGISIDGKAKLKKAKKFLRRHNIPYTSLIGEPAAVGGFYQRKTGSPWIGTPTFIIYSPSGKLVAETAGAIPTTLIEQFMGEYTASKQTKN